MRQMILILLVAILAASTFAMTACSKPEPPAQASSSDTKASAPAAAADDPPAALGAPTKLPETQLADPAGLEKPLVGNTPPPANTPEPGMGKNIEKKLEGPGKGGPVGK